MKDTIWIKGRFTPLALLLMLALPLVTSVVCLCFGRMNVGRRSSHSFAHCSDG